MHDRKSQRTSNRGELPQPGRGHIHTSCTAAVVMDGKALNAPPTSAPNIAQGKAVRAHFSSQAAGAPSQQRKARKRKKMQKYQKGGRRTAFIFIGDMITHMKKYRGISRKAI